MRHPGSSIVNSESAECDPVDRFERLDLEYVLPNHLADRAEALTAELERQGVRAVVFDATARPTVIVDRTFDTTQVGYATLVSCVSDAELDSVRARLRTLNLAKGESIGFGYDIRHDRIDIDTSLDERAIRIALPEPLADSDLVHVARIGLERLSRSSDQSPHRGGAHTNGAEGGCSSGFPIKHPSFGNSILTAGHCGACGTNVANGNYSDSFGTVIQNPYRPDLGNVEYDFAVVDGSTYTGRIYTQTNDTTTDALDGHTGPSLNVGYCMVGAESRRLCAEYDDLTREFCDAGGCTRHTALAERVCTSGVLGRRGDSGGPVIRELENGKVGARGLVVGGTRSCYYGVYQRYDHRFTKIAADFGFTTLDG